MQRPTDAIEFSVQQLNAGCSKRLAEFQVALLVGAGNMVSQGIALLQEIPVLTVEGFIPRAVAWIPSDLIRHGPFPVTNPYSKSQRLDDGNQIGEAG